MTGDREVPLHGGIANEGQVFRVGDTVRRPQRSWSPATHALLRHLEAVGFEGAPRFLGVDDQGREVLTYVPGATVVAPYPPWGLTDEALVSVAELLRAYHHAVAGFEPRAHAWPSPPPPAFVEGVVSHNDPNLDNIVFRDGRAVALIDFDLAGPGSRAWDVACAARLWAPLRPDVDIGDSRRGRGLDRLRLFVDSYGMDEAQRVQVARRPGELPLVLRADQRERGARPRGVRELLALGAARAPGTHGPLARRERGGPAQRAGCLGLVSSGV